MNDKPSKRDERNDQKSDKFWSFEISCDSEEKTEESIQTGK